MDLASVVLLMCLGCVLLAMWPLLGGKLGQVAVVGALITFAVCGGLAAMLVFG